MAQGVEARRAGRQRALAAALTRIAASDYRFCEDCGDFIGLVRLDADPCLVLCVACAR